MKLSSIIKSNRFRQAQSFVEFALALPILLLLIFGIIEFGRLLQAWLAIENGARFGVRYAVTGSYDPQFCQAAGQLFHWKSQGADIGSLDSYDRDASGYYDCNIPDTVFDLDGDGNKGEIEKTGEDLDSDGRSGENEDYQSASALLQDYARLPSIRLAAISGAMGIAWNPDAAVSGNYLTYLRNGYIESDKNMNADGSPDQDNRGVPSKEGYFNVSTCSNRITSDGFFVFNPNAFFYSPIPAGANVDNYRFPIYCQKAVPPDSHVDRYVDDAGGPGDRVRVVLTYRHTLITPFLSTWWPTLRLTAQREGVVEKFRTSRVTGLSGGIGFAATWTMTPLPPTDTMTPTETNTVTLTNTPTETLTPTSTPTAGCDALQNSTGLGADLLTFQNYGSDKGYVVQSKLSNTGTYNIYLTGANLAYNGAWHDAVQGPDPDRIFDLYGWSSNYTNPIYNPVPNPAANTNNFSHTFPSPKLLTPGTNDWFNWTYDRTQFLFWITPYARSYSNPLTYPNPTPTLDPFNGGSVPKLNFYWPSDWQGTINYNVVPDIGPTLACTIQMTGKEGPKIYPTFSPSTNFNTPFSIRAVVDGNTGPDQNVNYIYFFVYDHTGSLVHYYKESTAPYCIFGDSGGVCKTMRPMVDHWWYGASSQPGPLIVNDTYTIEFLATNKDGRPKSALIVATFTIHDVPTSTVTRTPPPTNTRTITGTSTKTSTITLTLPPTMTRTPTVTRTRTNTLPPSKTPTPTKTFTITPTATKCKTPIEMGGCTN
jgi:hypothetical protein